MERPGKKNDKLIGKIIEQGMALQLDLEAPEDMNQTLNPCKLQTLWADFKSDIVFIAKKHCHKSRRNLGEKIMEIKCGINTLARNDEITTNNDIRINEAYLVKELATLKHIQARDWEDNLRAVISNHGEVLGGAWSAMNKDRKPRDLLN